MGKQVTELDTLPSFTDTSLLPVHNGAGLKKGLLSQLASYLGNKFNNPNLLINPDFKINQRGKNTYDSQYSVDRWKIYNALYNVSTKNLSNPNSSDGNFVQTFENPLNGTYTITVYCSSVTGVANFTFGGENVIVDKEVGDLKKGNNIVTIKATNLNFIGVLVKSGASVNIDYIKLEQGTVATPFVAPNPAEELMRCERYFQKRINMFTFIGSTNVFSHATHFSEMRIKPTISTIENYKNNVNSYQSRVDDIFNGYYIDTTINSVNGAFVLLKLKFELDAELY